MSGIIEFRAVRQASNTVDTDLYDLRPLREAFDRFASGATLSFIDSDGTKIDDYPYGQRVDVDRSTDGGASWTTRFSGWAVDTTRTQRDGLPQVDVDIVGNDHLLRRNTIEKDYSSQAKSAILEDIVKTFTAVDWNGGADVSVQNDASIAPSFRGVKPDGAIGQIASESANEEYGVDENFNFFFRQQSISRAPPIGNADVIDHDLPTKGKRAINRFRLYYGSSLGNVVVVEDREAQKDLKAKLGTASNAIIADSDSKPEISSEDRAEAIARERLGTRSVIQTGTITVPLGRFSTSAGDVFELTLGDAGIAGVDFRVAQIDYRWQRGETQLTIARKAGGDIDDLLVSLSDSLANVRMRDADPNATETRYLGPIRSGVTVSASATLTTKTRASGGFVMGQSQMGQGTGDTLGAGVANTASVATETKRATVGLLNLMRDLWQDGNSAFTDLSHLGVGTDDSTATKADDALQSAVDRVAVEKFGATSNNDEFEIIATVPAGGVFAQSTLRELGPFDADTAGTLYHRLTHADVDLDADTRLKVHLVFTVDNDSDQQGVITNTGQQRIVDLLIGESGHEPSDFVYGTGTTDPAVGDTSLGSQQHEDSIDNKADGDPGVAVLDERTTDAEADTTNWSEFGLENSSNELLLRVVFEALSSDVILDTISEFEAANA